MRLFCSLLLLSLLSCSTADEEPNTLEEKDGVTIENGVLVLTDKNFDEQVKKHEAILVEFYAPWCSHCKSLAPEYDKAAKMLAERKSHIKLAKVDATKHMDSARAQSVQGFPTLKFFKEGKALDFNGPRNAEGIVSWVERKSGPPAVEIKDLKTAQKLIDDNDVVVFGFFKDRTSEDARNFLGAAEANDEIVFAITSSSELIKHYKTEEGKAVLFKKFDEKRADFKGDFEKDFFKFVKSESLPLVMEFSPKTAPLIFGTDIKTHFLLFVKPSEEEALKEQLAILNKVALENKGKVIFVHISGEEPSHQQVMDYFSFDKEDLPLYLIFQVETQKKFFARNNKVVKEDEVRKFLRDFEDGKIKPFFKTQELPENWDKEPVKVLVGKNLKTVAEDKTKDVFVEFMAPWCGHCKQLEPIWDELGKKYADHESIIIAKIDATANDVEGVEISGFPTLKLFKKGTNEIVDYSGKRDLDSLVHFLETGEIKKEEEKNPKEEMEATDEALKPEVVTEKQAEQKKEEKDKKKEKPKHTEL